MSGEPRPDNQSPSLDDLVVQDEVTPDELLEIVHSYINKGLPLDGGAVVALAERADLKPTHLVKLGALAGQGVEAQSASGKFGFSLLYAVQQTRQCRKVLSYVEGKAVSFAAVN